MTTSEHAVEAAGLSKRFGNTRALNAVDLTLEKGTIHALVGRNGAGKSTLVSLLTGLVRPDGGTIHLNGAPAPAFGDRAAWRSAVACVYQHSMIVPHLSVAENIFLGRHPATAAGFIDWHDLRTRAQALLEEWDLHLDLDAHGADLSVEERQLVEIMRALSLGARVLILDEPTARLEVRAIERLFQRLRTLRDAGVAVLFISHHLQEVYDLCDSVTVLRDGREALATGVSSLRQSELVEAMTGEDTVDTTTPSTPSDASRDIALEVVALSGDGFNDITLRLACGEIAGIAGIAGSGKGAFAETLAGLRNPRNGTVRVGGQAPRAGVRGALDAGIGFVPRDRHVGGLVLDLSVAENATMTITDRFGPMGWIDKRQRRANASAAMDALSVAAASPEQAVRELSGGNQQKVVIARAIARNPNVLVAVEPTAGVDVKSKERIRDELSRLRANGTAVLIVSDDLDDLRQCERVLVFFGGRLVAEVPAGWDDRDLVACIEGLNVA